MSGKSAIKGFDFQFDFGLFLLIENFKKNEKCFIQNEPIGEYNNREPWDITLTLNNGRKQNWQVKKSKSDFSHNRIIEIFKELVEDHIFPTRDPKKLSELISLKVIKNLDIQVPSFGLAIEGGISNKSTVLSDFLINCQNVINESSEVMSTLLSESLRYAVVQQFLEVFSLSSSSDIRVIASLSALFKISQFGQNEIRHTIIRKLDLDLGVSIKGKTYCELCSVPLQKMRSALGRPTKASNLLASLLSESTSNSELLESNFNNLPDYRKETVFQSQTSIGELFVHQNGKVFNSTGGSEDISSFDWLKSEISNQENFTIILGDFGFGKTTLVKYAVSSLQQESNAKRKKFLYLRLKDDYVEGSELRSIVQKSNKNLPLTKEVWEKNQWVIMCDGFDELTLRFGDEPRWITRSFTHLLRESEAENVQIILTSRPVLFLDNNDKMQTVNYLKRLYLEPFSEGQIKAWLSNWSLKNRQIKYEDICKGRLKEIVKIPVLLLLSAKIFHEKLQKKILPNSLTTIYSYFFDWSIKHEGSLGDIAAPKHFTPDNFRDVLEEVASLLFDHPDSKSGILHYKVILKELSKRYNREELLLNKHIFVAHAFKEKFSHVEFIHQSLREFLVASLLLRAFVEEIDLAHFRPNYELIFFDRPLTHAKVQFFIDLADQLPESTCYKLLELYNSESYLKNMLKFLTDDLEHRDYFNTRSNWFWQNEKAYKSTTKRNQLVIIGNIMMIEWFLQVRVFQKLQQNLSDGDVGLYQERIVSRLKELLHLFGSDKKFTPHIELIQKFGFVNTSWVGIKIKDIDFSFFNWKKCIFQGGIITKCKISSFSMAEIQWGFDFPTSLIQCKVSNGIVILQNVNILKCAESQFDNIKFIQHSESQIFFSQCILVNCNFLEIKKVTFDRCILINCQSKIKLDHLQKDSLIVHHPNFNI